jgi:hypothetical protein
MPLSSTQIGAIGENLLVNAVMKASDGRLSPFQPLADDDGLDVLFFDKTTGNFVAIQLKCRTVTLKKRGSNDRGNTEHFDVRKATFSDARRAWLVAALCDEALTQFEATWLIPLELLPEVAASRRKMLGDPVEQGTGKQGPLRAVPLPQRRGACAAHHRLVRGDGAGREDMRGRGRCLSAPLRRDRKRPAALARFRR